MSIILKALKSTNKDEEELGAEASEQANGGEGFFKGKEEYVKKTSFPFKFNLKLPSLNFGKNKRVFVLGGALIVVAAFALTMWFVNRDSGMRYIPAEVEIVKAPASPSPVFPSPRPSPPGGEGGADVVGNANQAFAAGNYDESIKFFKQAIEKAPDDAYLHNSLGLAYVEKDLYSSAAGEFQKALELDGGCAECFNNFGLLKSVLGETVEARKYLEKSISLSTSYPDPYFNLAVLYEKAGDIGNAVKYYRQFLELTPDGESDVALKIKRRVVELTGQ